MQELLEEAKESREEDPDTEETDEEFAEELMAYYEDLEPSNAWTGTGPGKSERKGECGSVFR